MARYPGATWQGSPNESPHGMVRWRGIILHIECGTETGTTSWFKNPQAQVSAHFGVGKDGHVDQFVDTADKAWAEAAGNPEWISVENEGTTGDSLTDAQIDANAHIYAWAVRQHGIRVQSTDSTNGDGLGWHGMGGDAWGGHYSCPGEPIKAQRPKILAGATELLHASHGQPPSAHSAWWDGHGWTDVHKIPSDARGVEGFHYVPYQGWMRSA